MQEKFLKINYKYIFEMCKILETLNCKYNIKSIKLNNKNGYNR